MSRYFRQFQHLLPRSEAWNIVRDKMLRKFFTALGRHPTEEAVTYVDLVWLDIFPQTTRQLDKWETQFALTGDGNEQTRRNSLAARWAAQGGQDPHYIQEALQAKGFDVYVHQWWEGNEAYADVGISKLVSPGSPSGLQPVGIWPREDGSRFYTVADNSNAVIAWDMAAAFDLANAVRGDAYDFTAQEPDPAGIAFNDVETRFYVGGATLRIHQFDMTTPGDVTSASFTAGQFLDVSTELSAVGDVLFNGEGTSLFVVGLDATLNEGVLVRYDLTDAWDVTTGAAAGSISIHANAQAPEGLSWGDSGFTLLVTDNLTDSLEAFALTLQYDGLSAAHQSSTPLGYSLPYGAVELPNRLDLWVVDRNTGTVNQWERYRPHDPRLYTNQPLLGQTQCGDPLALCGEQPPDQTSNESAVCSELLANETFYLWNDDLTQRAPPPVPDDPAYWPFFIYIGAQTFPDRADIPADMRAEFERTILQIAPTQQWVVLLINYISDDNPISLLL